MIAKVVKEVNKYGLRELRDRGLIQTGRYAPINAGFGETYKNSLWVGRLPMDNFLEVSDDLLYEVSYEQELTEEDVLSNALYVFQEDEDVYHSTIKSGTTIKEVRDDRDNQLYLGELKSVSLIKGKGEPELIWLSDDGFLEGSLE